MLLNYNVQVLFRKENLKGYVKIQYIKLQNYSIMTIQNDILYTIRFRYVYRYCELTQTCHIIWNSCSFPNYNIKEVRLMLFDSSYLLAVFHVVLLPFFQRNFKMYSHNMPSCEKVQSRVTPPSLCRTGTLRGMDFCYDKNSPLPFLFALTRPCILTSTHPTFFKG